MTIDFEELDYQETPLGPISLRRRADPRLDGEIICEVKLGDEFLMSSRFTASEIQLARLGLAAVEGSGRDVVVGGLGLGYTASAVLDAEGVASLTVIELLQPVIDWHRRGLVPIGDRVARDPRCRLVQADFFAWAMAAPDRRGDGGPRCAVDAVLLDIDHSPSHWLSAQNRTFYSHEGLRCLTSRLHPGGVFAMWSNDPPEDEFLRLLDGVFASVEPHEVRFPNPYLGGDASCTVYVARTRASSMADAIDVGGV